MNNYNSLKRLFTKRFLFLIIMLGSSVSINAQNIESGTSKIASANNSVFFELLGTGGFYSINYERMIAPKLTFRMGLSYVNFNNSESFVFDVEALTFPLSSSYLIQTDKDSFIEIGSFLTPAFYENTMNMLYGVTFGIREQDLTRQRVMVRFYIAPSFSYKGREEEQFFITGGLSIGSSF